MNKYEGLRCQCTLKRTKKFLSKLNKITAWCSISCCCHNLTTFALSPLKLIERGLFLFSNTAVSIVILFCVIILWSVGTNFAWNDVTQHTDEIAATSPLWHVIVIKNFILSFSPYHTLWTFGPLPLLSRYIFILWVVFIISILLYIHLRNYSLVKKIKIMN